MFFKAFLISVFPSLSPEFARDSSANSPAEIVRGVYAFPFPIRI